MSLAVLNSRIKKMECENKAIPQKYIDCFNDYIKKIINIRVDQEIEYLNDIIADKFKLGKFKSVNELIYAYKSLEKEYTKSRQRIAELEEQLKNAIVPKFKIGDYFIEYWDKEPSIYQYQGNKHFKCLNKKQGYHCDYVVLGALLLDEDFIQQISKEEAFKKLEELKGDKND